MKNPEAFFEKLEKAVSDKSKRKNIMTIAQYFEKKGMERGMERGMEAVAMRMLKAKQPIAYIIQMTGLTESHVRKLSQSTHQKVS